LINQDGISKILSTNMLIAPFNHVTLFGSSSANGPTKDEVPAVWIDRRKNRNLFSIEQYFRAAQSNMANIN
jgi:hypothetical protein